MRKKILTVVGARPQFIKASAISRAIAGDFSDLLEEVLVHTGQHYDDDMSQVFFDELLLPAPKYHLEISSKEHSNPTAAMMQALGKIFEAENPQALLVYGDTNSTLAAALEASFAGIPVIHVESGLRSFNKSMPEEINRILTDHVSTMLFAPTESAISNLVNEGFSKSINLNISRDHPAVFHCGDIMLDNALFFKKSANDKSSILSELNIADGEFFLATVHRDHNTDNPENLAAIMAALIKIGAESGKQIILPLHPRTNKMLRSTAMRETMYRLDSSPQVKVIPPVSYLNMISLVSNAAIIFTDSGGVQKESFFFQRPCVILRPQTEWIELVENGNAIITGADTGRIFAAYEFFNTKMELTWPSFYGNGNAAKFICEKIVSAF